MSGRAEVHSQRRCQSQLSVGEHERSKSRVTPLPAVSAYCSHCKLPLVIDVNTREVQTKSRATSTRHSERLCKECSGHHSPTRTERTPSTRLYKSASFDWTDVGDKIETWFEKAKTPDQRVVYNFLEKINTNDQRPVHSPDGKSLDDILDNLKRYRQRMSSVRQPNRFTHGFESTSWRVMRHPTGPRQFSRHNPAFGDDASRDFRIGTVFTTTEPRIGSTFLLHPGWV